MRIAPADVRGVGRGESAADGVIAKLGAADSRNWSGRGEVASRDKRQAAPFRKQDEPAAEPKKPGRKSGRRHGPHAHRSVPPRIDETYDVPLPQPCPHCGEHRRAGNARRGAISNRDSAHGDLSPLRRACRHVRTLWPDGGRPSCLANHAARGAAASQLGANVHAVLAILNKELGLSHGKSVKLLGTLFPELTIARGTSVRSIARTAERCAPAYEQLRNDLRGSPQVVPDETGWRVGRPHGLVACLRQPTGNVLRDRSDAEPRTGRTTAGVDWSGTLVHDGWSVYDRFTQAFHQQCVPHLQRRCQELLETAVRGAVRLPRAVLALIDRAVCVAASLAWPSPQRRRLGRARLGPGV